VFSRRWLDGAVRRRFSGHDSDFTRHNVYTQDTSLQSRAQRTLQPLPRIWTDSIEAHRQAVRDATLDATASLVAEHGLRSVTMAQVAQAAGIGRATLYKYFPDLDAILVAWHERQIASHLAEFAQVRDGAGTSHKRLEAALQRYAEVQRNHHGSELAALLHSGEHVTRAQQHLHGLLAALLVDAAADGTVRDDVPPDELASYCLSALTAAAGVSSKAARDRLVQVTLAGLGPRVDGQAAQRH